MSTCENKIWKFLKYEIDRNRSPVYQACYDVMVIFDHQAYLLSLFQHFW